MGSARLGVCWRYPGFEILMSYLEHIYLAPIRVLYFRRVLAISLEKNRGDKDLRSARSQANCELAWRVFIFIFASLISETG